MKTRVFRLFNLVLMLAMLLTCAGQASAAQDAIPPQPPAPLSADFPAGAGPRQDQAGLWYMPAERSLTTGAIHPAGVTATGGPDEYGYTWNDAEPLSWIDASAGTDRNSGLISLGFNFKFYENTYSQIYLSQYGYATFDTNLTNTQSKIPAPGTPNNIIAPYWSPTANTNGYIRYLTGVSAQQHYFVTEWNHVVDNSRYGTEEFTFELILYENGDILFQYQSMSYASGGWMCQATGIEDSQGKDGLPTTNYCATVGSNHAVRISRPAPSARMSINSLSQSSFTRPGETVVFQIPIRNTGELGTDTYDLVPDPAGSLALYAPNGTTLLTDTNGNGVVDTGPVAQGATTTVLAKMKTPADAVVGAAQSATINASSSQAASASTKLSALTNESNPPQQSTTGPVPPPAVIQRDSLKTSDQAQDVAGEVTLPVPDYLWRHGCGPTALGMVVGYYDSNGFGDLIPGSALTQTTAVGQAIASGGDVGSPFPAGSERHFEDYASPVDDSSPVLLTDSYLTSGRTAHSDDSLADFMNTSKSTYGNFYGWSWSSDVGPAFTKFIQHQNRSYIPSYQQYSFSYLSWSLLTSEIDSGHPLVVLVDSDGNGSTDHFVPVIGYRTSPRLQYASWDTWYTTIRWQNFTGMAIGVPWGIWGGWTFRIDKGKNITLQTTVPAAFVQVYQDASDGTMDLNLVQPGGQQIMKMAGSGTYGNYPSVTETPNGNFMYAWSKSRCLGTNCSPYVDEIQYTLANKWGQTVRGVSKLVDNSSVLVNTYDYDPVIAAAPDGHIGVLWDRELYQSVNNTNLYGFNIMFAVLDSAGNLAYGPVNLTNNTEWAPIGGTLDSPDYFNPKISATGDNRFILVWGKEYNIDDCTSNDCSMDDIYYSVRGSAGGEVKSVTKLTNDTTGSSDEAYYSPGLAGLTGNRALVTWSRGSDEDIYYAVLDSSGSLKKDKTNLSGDGWNSYDWESDVAQLSDGTIVVAWTGWNSSSDYTIRFATLDANYSRSSGPTPLNNPAGVAGNNYVSIAADRAGNGVLTWTDYDYTLRHNLYYAVVNGSGSILTQPMIFRSSATNATTLEIDFSGYGNTSYSSIPAGVDSSVLSANMIAGGKPGGVAQVGINYTSKGQATGTGIQLTANLGGGLTYVQDTSGITPAVNGSQVTWNLPEIGFLDQDQFVLSIGVPAGAAIGTRYQVTLAIGADQTDVDPADNTASLQVMAGLPFYLPRIMR